MKTKDILDALRNGAAIHLSLAEKPRWTLHDGDTVRTISSTQVRSLLKCGAIASAGDSLFPDSIPSQTWRGVEPK
jgi:hypothetical protein